MKDGQARIDVLEAMLRAFRAYVEPKAKVRLPKNGVPIPNVEMKLLTRIHEVLK